MSEKQSNKDNDRKSFVASMKIIVSGACAVVIGLAWKDYILSVINSVSPFLQNRLSLNPHVLSFIFIVGLTIVLSLLIHILSL